MRLYMLARLRSIFKLLALLLRGPEHVQVWQLIIELESYTP